ncbi:hypothetical protein F4803DRAFT_548481 [Xylaria telfairii]|nr:hypothetical protein F4803DRAFT_548481 [Xylaria telfairii]
MEHQIAARRKTRVSYRAATTFTGFGKLPTELRLMIWEEFARTPRIIRVDETGMYDGRHRKGQFAIRIDGDFREQVCPLLGVCRESRTIAIKDMLLFTLWSTDSLRDIFMRNRHFAIRQHDIVFFSGSRTCYYDLHGKGDCDKIANIMLGERVCEILGQKNTSESIWANWLAFGYTALGLTSSLRNQKCLEKIYGLVHEDNNTGAVKPFEMDDLVGIVPSEPPEFQIGVANWLRRRVVKKHEWKLMREPAMLPYLVIHHTELAPWLKSKQVVVREHK